MDKQWDGKIPYGAEVIALLSSDDDDDGVIDLVSSDDDEDGND